MTRNGSSNGRNGLAAVPGIVLDQVRGDASDPDGRHPLRPSAGTGLLLVLASALLSAASYGPLPADLRIRWSIGTSYGPEFAPAALVLAAFPLALAATFVGVRLVAGLLARTGDLERVRGIFEACVLGGFLVVLLVQAGLVVANLL